MISYLRYEIENEPLTENDDVDRDVLDHPNFIPKFPKESQEKVEDVTKADESGEEVPKQLQIGHIDSSNDCCAIPVALRDEIDGTTIPLANNHRVRPIHLHSLEDPDLSLGPRTPNLVVSNGPWKTDIPPTPDGYPPSANSASHGFPESTRRQHESKPFQVDAGGFHDCRSNVTSDLITCLSPGGRAVEEEAGNDIVVTPVIKRGPVTRVVISQ